MIQGVLFINRGQSVLDTCLELNDPQALQHAIDSVVRSGTLQHPLEVITGSPSLGPKSPILRCLLNPNCTNINLLRVLLHYGAPTKQLPDELHYLAPLSLILRRTKYQSKYKDQELAVAMGRILIEHGVHKMPYETYTRPFKQLVATINKCKKAARVLYALGVKHARVHKPVMQWIARMVWETRANEKLWTI